MKRVIKFRAWDKEENKFFKPTYEAYKGNLIDLHIDLTGSVSRRTINQFEHESMYPDRYILSQFTGLLDNNGKEIYEGDILRCKGYVITNKKEMKEYNEDELFNLYDPNMPYPKSVEAFFNNEVQWFEGNHHGYRFKRGSFTCSINQMTIHNMHAVVVGNIYQNSDLIK